MAYLYDDFDLRGLGLIAWTLDSKFVSLQPIVVPACPLKASSDRTHLSDLIDLSKSGCVDLRHAGRIIELG